MRLLHYSNAYLTKVENRRFTRTKADGSKPAGLWVSVEGPDDWKTWCEDKNFDLDHLTHVTEVVLAANAKIKRIQTSAAFMAFHREFKCRPAFAANSQLDDHYWDGRAIRWDDIAKEHDGIIIAPYQGSCRLVDDAPWYLGWDCASGCIWNADAIAELRPVPQAIAA